MSLDRHVKPTLCPTDVSAHPQWFAQVSMQMYSAKDVYKCHRAVYILPYGCLEPYL